MDLQNLMERIKKHEGFVNKIYKDSLGFATIGYGHLITPSDTFVEGKEYTKEELEYVFKDDFNNPRDYEIRFYIDHQTALNSKLIVEEVIGENAILASRDVTWKEGNSDRRVNRRGAGSGPGSAKAKYLYYLIYENAVIMCEGLNEEESIKLCNNIIK